MKKSESRLGKGLDMLVDDQKNDPTMDDRSQVEALEDLNVKLIRMNEILFYFAKKYLDSNRNR